MVDPEDTNWLYDYGIENIVNFSATNSGFSLPTQALHGSSNAGLMETRSKKRTRPDACAPSSSKACREKQRRDRLNERFMDLAVLLEPGQPPKTDKFAILVDVVRIISQLKSEAHNLTISNSNLQELKREKIELREEKHKLKAEKDRLEQQLKSMSTPLPQLLPAPTPIPAAFITANQAPCNKLVPCSQLPHCCNVALHAKNSSRYFSRSCSSPTGCLG